MLECFSMNTKLWLKLYLTKQLSSTDALKLIKKYGGLTNIFTQTAKDLSATINKNLGTTILDDNIFLEPVEQIMNWLQEKKNRHVITLDNDYYPELLANLPIPPLLFFAEGNIELLKNLKFAIVGTRNPSQQGIDNANNFAQEIASNGYTIVSGLAEGIDAAAHYGALKTAASTIAVIGTGINKYYPIINKNLQDKIKAQGLLISPFMLNDGPRHFHFPNRNKIIIGLSQGCLVVESRISGGSMISANFAADIGREVFAIPGSIHNINAQGCHKLIKNGAKLVENIHDIFDEIPYTQIKQEKIDFTCDETKIMNIISHHPINIEEICKKTNMQIAVVCDILLQLELQEIIKNSVDGYYKTIK
jgi:DNA processing protein